MSAADYFSITGIILSLIGFLFTWYRTNISDIRKLENRLVTLEQHKVNSTQMENRLATIEANSFNPSDRESLSELQVKVGVFWSIIESEAPKLLKRVTTPYLDILLSKAETGLSHLSSDEQLELYELLKVQYENEIKGDVDAPGRALVNALYRARISMGLNTVEPEKCKPIG